MKLDQLASDEVENRQRAVHVPLLPLQQFLQNMKTEMHLEESIVAVCLVSETEMARLNKTYRKIPGPTDVLSFPSVPGRKLLRFRRRKMVLRGGSFLGDIAISPATARRYAKKNGRTLLSEIQVLILHGVLHLLGYDHETDRGQMDEVEQKLRERFGLAL
jgi:probable rRNA maturation factor